MRAAPLTGSSLNRVETRLSACAAGSGQASALPVAVVGHVDTCSIGLNGAEGELRAAGET